MDEMVDGFLICIYCGDTMDAPTPQQEKIFGKATCCGYNMLKIERDKMHTIVRAMDKLRSNLESELLKGML